MCTYLNDRLVVNKVQLQIIPKKDNFLLFLLSHFQSKMNLKCGHPTELSTKFIFIASRFAYCAFVHYSKCFCASYFKLGLVSISAPLNLRAAWSNRRVSAYWAGLSRGSQWSVSEILKGYTNMKTTTTVHYRILDAFKYSVKYKVSSI